jgi:1,4-alpha-glucan branching enzyme
MIKLAEVGATNVSVSASGVTVTFGVYLPDVNSTSGYDVRVRIIHSADRFNPLIPTFDQPLSQVPNSTYNLWSGTVTVPIGDTHQGQPGTYLYRYQLRHTQPGSSQSTVVVDWFTDPFARATDVGKLSAFSTPDQQPPFQWTDSAWRTPELADLVVYELHVEQFNSTFDGVLDRLDYLRSLGVTCLELMPVSSLKVDFDWGYGPLHYFAPNARWGGAAGLKRLVDACHTRGMAVILDMVYQHVDGSFPYQLVYAATGLPSPMIGEVGQFGPEIDYSQPFARDYVASVNAYWLNEFHVDGFRYDEVTDLYQGPTDQGYAKLAYDTYNLSFGFARFTPSGVGQAGEYSRIIQCAEALGKARDVLTNTYTSCAWVDDLLNLAEQMASSGQTNEALVDVLGVRFDPYPTSKTVQDRGGHAVDLPQAVFRYLESHDHSQLITFFGTDGDPLDPLGDQSRFYKVQPYAIAMYTSRGVPMLWEGLEIVQNYTLPPGGNARIHFRRDLQLENFYEAWGHALIRVCRQGGTLRAQYASLRSAESYYYNLQSNPADGILLYRRGSVSDLHVAVVALNFSDTSQMVQVPFPTAGTYREMMDDDVRTGHFDVLIGARNQQIPVTIPANYGFILVRQ